MKKLKNILSITLCFMLVVGSALLAPSVVSAAGLTASELYVRQMGTGVNLGNSFDSFDRIYNQPILDETAWGNPEVTSAYINSLKQKGFNSIRIPFTSFTRTDANYQINEVFLQRYENVVNYALDAGFYVMINLHHDSSEWLKYWDGDPTSEEYVRFVALWTQLANRFKDYGNRLMFESVNEVYFDACSTDEQQNQFVGTINQAFYDVVRASGGNNATRMLVLPTSYTNHGLVYSEYLVDFIQDLDDPNVIATVHYYVSAWYIYAFTCNIGLPMFDEESKYEWTAREAVDEFYDCLEQTFVENGIGVIIGEYGLFNMGAPDSLEDGEVVKFIEYMNYKANALGMCTMIWDCGNIIDRYTGGFINSIWGDVILTSMSERSSYAAGLDNLFVTNYTSCDDIQVPLALNGNSLTAIYNGATQLVQGTDYTYSSGTVTLKGSCISGLINGDYGVKADLRFVFSDGSDWHQYINYAGTAIMESINAPVREDDGFLARYDTDGTPTYPSVIIPMDYNGKTIKRIASYDEFDQPASANTWASDYMQCGGEYVAAYDQDLLCLMNWYYNAIPDGTYTLVIDFYDGTTANYSITKANDNITGYQIWDTNVDYNFYYITDWVTGCNCSLTITNTTGIDFTNGWTIEFDFDRVINNVYGARLVSYDDGHCVISNESWNPVLLDGDSINITFLAGSGNTGSTVTNCVLK